MKDLSENLGAMWLGFIIVVLVLSLITMWCLNYLLNLTEIDLQLTYWDAMVVWITSNLLFKSYSGVKPK